MAPNRPLNPLYPPGSSGSRSGLAPCSSEQRSPGALSPALQWIAMPSKSATASLRVLPGPCVLDQSAKPCSLDGLPNTFVMSPLGVVFVFSSSMLAIENAPTSQPAPVHGPHRAGVFFCPSVIRLGSVSFSVTGSVQYVNADVPPGAPFVLSIVPSVLKTPNELDTPMPLRSGYRPVRLEMIPPAVCEIRIVWSLDSSEPLFFR